LRLDEIKAFRVRGKELFTLIKFVFIRCTRSRNFPNKLHYIREGITIFVLLTNNTLKMRFFLHLVQLSTQQKHSNRLNRIHISFKIPSSLFYFLMRVNYFTSQLLHAGQEWFDTREVINKFSDFQITLKIISRLIWMRPIQY